MKPDPLIGSELSHYRITGLLGRGGMGVVYLAEDLWLERMVALKVLPPQLSGDEAFRVRFLRESKLAASLDHPNVIPIYEAGETDGSLFIAMRYVDGTDLRALIRERGHLDLEISVGILSQIGAALDAAHAKGLVHRDVKPANVLLGGTPETSPLSYLADFGLSRLAASQSGVTSSGQFLGTVHYCAPEQIEGGDLDGRADVYSLGCVAYECFTGHVPFERDAHMAVLWAHLHEPLTPASSRRPGLPPGLNAPLSRCLAKSPADRYRSCSEFVVALEASLGSAGAATLIENGRRSTARGRERKLVTVLVCDLAGLAPDHADPEDTLDAIRPYHARIRTKIDGLGGTVEKIVGDAVMAVFGAPMAHEDDAERAVRAGFSIIEAIREQNESHPGPDLTVRIGISTGQAVVTLGSPGQGIVTGDVVRTAFHVQRATPAGTVTVAEATHRATKNLFEYDPLDPIQMAGWAEPVPIWRAVSARSRFRLDVSPEPSTPFVGREDELELLKRTFHRAIREPSTQLATLTGEPGVGKTRLIHEFFAFISSRSADVSWRQGRCLSHGEGGTFWPLEQIVREQCGILELDGLEESRQKLHDALDALGVDEGEREWLGARLLPLVVLDADVGPTEREENFGAWRVFLERVAAETPYILVLEDLHWADPAMLEFVNQLGEYTRGVPLMIICSSRPELFDSHPSWGGGRRNATTISLAPLSREDTATLVSSMLGHSVRRKDVHRLLVERSAGNPLYAEEFLRTLKDRGIGSAEEKPSAHKSVQVESIPDSIQALIAARLDTLDPATKTMLQDASVVGIDFQAEALAEMGKRNIADVHARLHELARRELALPASKSAARGEDKYSFSHVLVRDVCYGQIPRAGRAEKHAQVAAWHERSVVDRKSEAVEVIAHHSLKAIELRASANLEVDVELCKKAVNLLGAVCKRSLSLGDIEKARATLRRAQDLISTTMTEGLSPAQSTVTELGRVAISLGDWETAIEFLRGPADAGIPEAARDIGVALCKLHGNNPAGDLYKQGQNYLETSASLLSHDAEPIASLAGSWKSLDVSKAHALYHEALQRDPSHPYSLGNYLEFELRASRKLVVIDENRAQIMHAIDRCRQNAARAIDLPWTYFDLGKFLLMLGEPYESVMAYAKAVQSSSAQYMIETSLRSLDVLEVVTPQPEGYRWARCLLELGIRARFPGSSTATSGESTFQSSGDLIPPVVVVAGGSKSSMEDHMQTYGGVLIEGFEGYEGTVISGGTTQGVSALVGDVRQRHGQGHIRAVGYAPAAPAEVSIAENNPDRYDELRLSEEKDYSPLESLRYWSDIIGSGIPPRDVNLIGVGGGEISAIEFRIALAFGAQVGILAGSGRAADVLNDPAWMISPNLFKLSSDARQLRSFLESRGSD